MKDQKDLMKKLEMLEKQLAKLTEERNKKAELYSPVKNEPLTSEGIRNGISEYEKKIQDTKSRSGRQDEIKSKVKSLRTQQDLLKELQKVDDEIVLRKTDIKQFKQDHSISETSKSSFSNDKSKESSKPSNPLNSITTGIKQIGNYFKLGWKSVFGVKDNRMPTDNPAEQKYAEKVSSSPQENTISSPEHTSKKISFEQMKSNPPTEAPPKTPVSSEEAPSKKATFEHMKSNPPTEALPMPPISPKEPPPKPTDPKPDHPIARQYQQKENHAEGFIPHSTKPDDIEKAKAERKAKPVSLNH